MHWQGYSRSAFSAVVVVLLSVSGCGDAGTGGASSSGLGGLFGASVVDDGKEFGGDDQSASPYRDKLTSDEAYHLLRRASFGATPEQVSDSVRRGLSATVDGLIGARTEDASINTLSESYEDDIAKRWLVYLIEGKNPLREKMAMFWHDRFATSQRVLSGRDRGLALLHWKMLRSNALGDYRDFLEQLTIDPLMLIWLDGANSPKDNPNENYTREFWELFTLGRDVLYTENDIREGSRAFTGITLLRESDMDARPIFDLINHDETIKTVFPGRAAPENFDYVKMIDLTLEQSESAEYVASNLFKLFVHDEPSNVVVRDLASLFRESDFQIAPLVRSVLRSQAMFSSKAHRAQISSPVQHVVGVARTLDMHIHSEESQGSTMDRLVRDLRSAGEELMNPPGVEGWGENEAWLQDQWIISRVNALGRTMDYGTDRTERLPLHLLPPQIEWAEREIRGRVVDAMAAVFHLELTEEERDIYIEVLDQDGWRAFHLVEPDNQPRHVFEMIRLMAMDERVIGS